MEMLYVKIHLLYKILEIYLFIEALFFVKWMHIHDQYIGNGTIMLNQSAGFVGWHEMV